MVKSFNPSNFKYICDALHDLVPFVQFKKSEKHPWSSVTLSKVKRKTPPWVFFTYFVLNCTNGNKSRKASHISTGALLFSHHTHSMEHEKVYLNPGQPPGVCDIIFTNYSVCFITDLISYTRRKTELDMYNKNLCIQVVFCVAERLQIINLRKY